MGDSHLFTSIGPTLTLENEDDWRRARRSFLGGSDAAVLYGHGYKGQGIERLFAEKAKGLEPTFSKGQLRRFALGKNAEPIIREFLADETNFDVIAPPEGKFIIHTHPDHTFIAATLDAVIAHPTYGLVPGELKRVGLSQAKMWKDGGTPVKFVIQCQHQMLVTGSRAAVLAGMLDEDNLEWRLVLRDDDFLKKHIEQCCAFWEMVESGVYNGPVTGEEGVGEALTAIFGEPDPTLIKTLGPDEDELAKRYKTLGEDAKRIEKDRDECKNKLRFALGEAGEGHTPKGVRVRFVPVEACSYTVNRKAYLKIDLRGME